MPKFGMPISKSKGIFARLKYPGIILILRSKVKVIQSSWMYATNRTMVIHSRAKQNMSMSKDNKAEVWTQSHVIIPINLTLRSMVNVVSGSWMYLTHILMVINPCAKYGKPMSIQKIVMGREQKHVKNPINLPLRSKFKVVSGSWKYPTHCHCDTSMCQIWSTPPPPPTKKSAQSDGRTDRVIPINIRPLWFIITKLVL